MVELQSCAGLVNASALCVIEQEVKGESAVHGIAQISAELQREREKNAELMERISMFEAQLQERDKESFLTNEQGTCINAAERSLKKFKRQKVGTVQNGIENGNVINVEMVSQMQHDAQCIPLKNANLEDHLVNWMSMDETQFLHVDKLKENSAGECDDTDDRIEEDDYEEANTKNRVMDVSAIELREHVQEDDFHEATKISCLASSFKGQNEQTIPLPDQVRIEYRKDDCLILDAQLVCNEVDVQTHDKRETKNIGCHRTPADGSLTKEACHTGPGGMSLLRNPPKVAFCAKEVKRMLELEALLQKNAQSHTIRKIIVFASLCIRHGFDDMCELDFNHFSILRKGEPYVSPNDPGECVLYENLGIRRKIFYPNRKNPTLCPVQILKEEKAMRPSDPSCPSCLFLCIKYGGRTRNLPQNEYVRQRMGRKKLKSFGPLMCRMAMLVHIRSGSFFFKALGITLLFMAGFPDDLVQRETKYRNLDLLQKYYRTDEDAEGEELFLPPKTCDTEAGPGPDNISVKTTSKPKAKKQANSIRKPHVLPKSSMQESAPSSSTPPSQFGLKGYTSIQTPPITAFQSMPCQTQLDNPSAPTPVIKSSGYPVSYHNQTLYHMFPLQTANSFMPMMYWSAPSVFPPYNSTYGYQSFPSAANYIPIHQQPYYSHPTCSSLIPKIAENNRKNDVILVEADSNSDTDSSSSSTEPKEALAS